MLNCDCYFDRKCRRGVKPREPDMLKETQAEGIASAVTARKTEERLARAGKDPVVAVCLGATSAKMVFRSLDDCPLFAQLLPSIARTLQPGFECVAPHISSCPRAPRAFSQGAFGRARAGARAERRRCGARAAAPTVAAQRGGR